MIFFSFSQGHGSTWAVGPLLFILPMLMPYDSLFAILASIFGNVAQLIGLHEGEGDVLQLLLHLLFSSIFVLGVMRLFRYVRQNGGIGALMRLLLVGAQGGGPVRPAPFFTGRPLTQQQQRQQQQARPPRATIEEVAAALQKLPTEVFATPDDLGAMSAHELKERAAARGLDPGLFVEKKELVDQLKVQDEANSSACTCAICSEDYGSGDALRVLRCGHKFHIECVDRWLLACDFSRPPACPMCNAELLQRHASSS